jgi:glutamate racemase
MSSRVEEVMRIGVFDSGVGGITVLMKLMRGLPGHHYVYVGDNGNLPYGTKSVHQLRRILASYEKKLQGLKLDALVLACNTASSLVLEDMERLLPGVPVVGVLKPGIQAAREAVRLLPMSAEVVLLATRATVRSQRYEEVWLEQGLGTRFRSIACPLLVPLIEEGWWDHPALDASLKSYLEGTPETTGVYLLGCTHYPWIAGVIQSMKPQWTVVDASHQVLDTVSQFVTAGHGETCLAWHFSDPESLPKTLWTRIQAALPPHRCIVPVSENTP